MAVPSASSAIGVAGRPAVASSRLSDAVVLTRPVDDKAELDPGAERQRRQRHVALGLRGDQHLRLAVVQDIGELLGRQEGVHARVIMAGPLARRAAFDIARVVLHVDRVVIDLAEAASPQQMRKPVAARFELAVGDRLAGPSHDHGRMRRARRSMFAQINFVSSAPTIDAVSGRAKVRAMPDSSLTRPKS